MRRDFREDIDSRNDGKQVWNVKWKWLSPNTPQCKKRNASKTYLLIVDDLDTTRCDKDPTKYKK